MITPHVTEILPTWTGSDKTANASRARRTAQRDLVMASLLGEANHGDVYPARRPAAPVRARGNAAHEVDVP